MVNPFDNNFFHFLIGFSLILCFSFSILYFTGKYGDVVDTKAVADSSVNP
jgi:hypothetical protein